MAAGPGCSRRQDGLSGEIAAIDLAPSKWPARPQLPTELVELVLLELSPPAQAARELTRHTHGRENLLNAALVSKQWSEAARRVLFDKLHLVWFRATSYMLCRTFDANPAYLNLVRRVLVDYPDEKYWLLSWRESKAGRAAVAEAKRLFPTGDRKASYLDFQGRSAAHALGDSIWWTPAGRLAGSEEFWHLVGRMPNLSRISMRKMPQDLDDASLVALRPVLSRLITVAIDHGKLWDAEDESDAEGPLPIIPYLDSLQTLALSTRTTPTTRPGPRPLSYPLYLSIGRRAEFHFQSLETNLSKLHGIETLSTTSDHFHQLMVLIPTLPELRYLRLLQPLGERGRHDKAARALTFSTLRSTNLSHLSLDIWPSPPELAALPAIQVLEVSALGDERCEAVLDWKAKYLPALSVLIIRCPYSFRSGEPAAAIIERATNAGFLLRIGRTERLELPGDWWGV